MNKITCACQNTEAKTLLVDVCIFGRFGRLSFASVHSDYCWFNSEVKWSIYVSSIVTYLCKKLLFVVLKQLQTMLWILDALLFLIDCEQTWHPLWTQLSHWQMFMQNDEYNGFWYLQLLCYLTQLQFILSKMSLWSFWCFQERLVNLGKLNVQHHLYLYNCIWSQQCFINTQKSDFSIVLKICNSSFP